MLNEEHVLSEATVNALMPLLRMDPLASPSLADDAFVSFVMGTATEAEYEKVLAALVQSPRMRERLITLSAQAERIARTPLGSLSSEPFDPILLERFHTSLHGSLETFGQARTLLIRHGWDNLGRDGLHALRSALASAGEALRHSLSGPRFSPVRAPRGGFEQGSDPAPDLGVAVDVWLSGNGDLQTRIRLIERVPGALEAIRGRTLFLNLIDPAGGLLPIGRHVVDSDETELAVPGFLGMTNLPESYISAELFHVSFEGESPVDLEQNRLFAEISPDSSSAAIFEIVDLPRVEEEHLCFTLIASEPLRRRFAEHRLELSIPVGSLRQVLGSWPMSEWTEESRTFRIPVPEAKGVRFECGSVLHAKLVRL